MRLLVVEDDPLVTAALIRSLGKMYTIDACERMDEALHLAGTLNYLAILLDLGLPDGDGIELCRQLRDEGITAPILVLTGRGDEIDKVTALDAGADDYLLKPFSAGELAARLRAVIRRGPRAEKTLLIAGRLALDPSTRTVTYQDTPVTLRRKEFDLLEYFMRNPGHVLSRMQLLEQVWDHDSELITNTVDVHIKYLRDRIDRPHSVSHIKTVHGLGYKFEPDYPPNNKGHSGERI